MCLTYHPPFRFLVASNPILNQIFRKRGWWMAQQLSILLFQNPNSSSQLLVKPVLGHPKPSFGLRTPGTLVVYWHTHKPNTHTHFKNHFQTSEVWITEFPFLPPVLSGFWDGSYQVTISTCCQSARAHNLLLSQLPASPVPTDGWFLAANESMADFYGHPVLAHKNLSRTFMHYAQKQSQSCLTLK